MRGCHARHGQCLAVVVDHPLHEIDVRGRVGILRAVGARLGNVLGVSLRLRARLRRRSLRAGNEERGAEDPAK